MKWQKGGLIYAPAGDLWWAKRYATLPTAALVDEDTLRVYFASLDERLYGRIGYVDLDANDPQKILYETREPVLDIGPLGAFDDCGVNPSCVLTVNGETYLYYIGWQRCERVPYMLFAGLAISRDNGLTFRKYAPVPVLDRTADDPFSRSAPFVCIEHGRFRAWYWSCVEWSTENGRVHYNNVIKSVYSNDGFHWPDKGVVCIAPDNEGDYSVGRPWVIRDKDAYQLWYSIRSKLEAAPYRIGYAESCDGVNWIRKDNEAGIAISENGWDSEMLCYPCVVDVRGRRYMFYNGNRHGSTGFGYAVLEA